MVLNRFFIVFDVSVILLEGAILPSLLLDRISKDLYGHLVLVSVHILILQ